MLNSTVKKTLIVIGGTALAAGAAYLAVRNFDTIATTASEAADVATDVASDVAEATTEVAVSALSTSAQFAGELV